MPTSDTPRTVRLNVSLPPETAEALTFAATREDRPLKAQAARYITASLRRDGYLPPDESDPAAPLTFGPFAAVPVPHGEPQR
jgi:hypothetical protein